MSPPDTAVTVEPRQSRSGPRLAIVIEGKRRQTLSLSLDQAAMLAAQLQRHLPEVTVTRREVTR